MGCFLDCFGFSGKRRCRKSAKKVLPRDHRLGSYEPLDSSVENPTSSDSQLSNKIKERSSIRIGKKVSFNLNVQTYETLKNEETAYQLLASDDEEEKRENNGEGSAKGSLSFISEGDSTASKMGAFPSNHRYRNCRDGYDDDDDDDMAYTESDLEDEDEEDEWDDEFEYDYDDENDIDDDQRISENEFSKQINNQLVESSERNKINNPNQLCCAPTDGESKPNARERSNYLNSVLSPIDNLTQWKEVKARRMAAPKHPRKENVGLQPEAPVVPFDLKPNLNRSKPLMQEIAIDASLSNWLVSPPNYNES